MTELRFLTNNGKEIKEANVREFLNLDEVIVVQGKGDSVISTLRKKFPFAEFAISYPFPTGDGSVTTYLSKRNLDNTINYPSQDSDVNSNVM